MQKAVEESNEWGADLHYVSHTNAFNGEVQGYRPIIYTGSKKGKQIADCIIAERKKIYDKPIRLNERTDLYELRVPKATSFYEEHVFHDNLEEATWFHNNLKNIARATCKGMCKYFGIPFVEPKAEKVETDVLYRIQVGAFSVKANSEAYLKKVQAAGFPEAYIKAEKR
jgi:N-acetylmuramoyl-L-alanine amidase